MMAQELVRKDLQDRLDEFEERIEVLQKLLNDPEELSTAQKEAIFRQIRDVTTQIQAAGTRLREGRSSELLIAGVEMTQATQYFLINGQGSGYAPNNSVPLVSKKAFYLRVYVDHKPLPLDPLRVSVNGRLRYERIGAFPASFPALAPFNGPITGRPINSVDRGEFNHTLNFSIPVDHCQGTLRLTVEIFEQPLRLEPSSAVGAERAISDSLTVVARFQEVPAAEDLEVTKLTLTAQTVTVEWSARHPTRSLVYLLDFSPDDGRTWQTVAACGGKSRWSVDSSLLPGGDRCRFRVLASSGIRTVAAQTEPFTLPKKPRRAFILAPEPGQVLSPGDLLVLRGGGFSPGLGLSEPRDVLWMSSVDGVLGRGYELVTSDLSEGPHTLTLTVPDGLGGIGSSQLTVLVRAPASSDESLLRIR